MAKLTIVDLDQAEELSHADMKMIAGGDGINYVSLVCNILIILHDMRNQIVQQLKA